MNVTKTGGGTAAIAWDPQTDDPRGHIARAVETGELADALAALGADDVATLDPQRLEQITYHAAHLQTQLERRTRELAVVLRRQGMSWADLAATLYDDASMRSSARRVYEAGLRQMGLPTKPAADDSAGED